MEARSSGSSTAQRLRTSTSNRLTEALLSSGGKVAGVGLATAILTLVFAIWFGLGMRHNSQVGAPLARSAAALNAAITHSLAALRGWVAYGNPDSRVERLRVWNEQIAPTLADLESLAGDSVVPDMQAKVAKLRSRLRELESLQWAIEDVAQTPGNQPAAVAYEQRLDPLRRNILQGFEIALEQHARTARSPESIDFLSRLARFRSSFTQGDLALSSLLRSYDEIRERAALQRIATARRLAVDIADERLVYTSGDLAQLLAFSLQEFRAYDAQAQEVIALRRSASWNAAQLLATERGVPLILETREIASDLAESQAEATEAGARLLAQASYLVIAMALAMGLISAGSLLVSRRLKQQVHNVMDRAKRLGQYQIEESIGKGGMGEVYLARHAMLQRPTAIKLLRGESARDLRAQRRFQREVQLTCQLTHPNTIEIFDYGRTPEGVFYYAMEYLDGFTIEALVSRMGPVAPARVVHMLLQACGSLHEAHERGLLHRDIKPSNIMLTSKGGVFDTVKILDFGLVQDLASDEKDESDERGVIVGTPMYLAPELVLTPGSGSPAADLYALGAVGYFMLSGATVFPPGELLEILAHQINEVAPFPSERLGRALPQDLEYVIMACLAKNPADRPSSAARMAEMLHACDCGVWSEQDARFWWEEYGEALRNKVSIDLGQASWVQSSVVVDDTTG